MANEEIMKQALQNYQAAKEQMNRIKQLVPGIEERQSTPLLKKMFDPEFQAKVELEIMGGMTYDWDAVNIAGQQIKKVVQGG